jgi:hypothetical protein
MQILSSQLRTKIIRWLLQDVVPPRNFPLSNFERIQYEIRPCDVLLVEGRSRVSRAIQMITQSPWTHAALYIGRLYDISDPALREYIQQYYKGEPDAQLILESILGKGIIVSPLTIYQDEHIRICRPNGIARQDAQAVIAYLIKRLGMQYNVRQMLDLARFLFPWAILPRRWRSSLFNHNTGSPTREICSSVIAEAFQAVDFPILPILDQQDADKVALVQRNPRLFTPSDFDYSPFFDIIKYPIIQLTGAAAYRKLPWRVGAVSDDDGKVYMTNAESKQEQEEAGKEANKKPGKKFKTLDFFD